MHLLVQKPLQTSANLQQVMLPLWWNKKCSSVYSKKEVLKISVCTFCRKFGFLKNAKKHFVFLNWNCLKMWKRRMISVEEKKTPLYTKNQPTCDTGKVESFQSSHSTDHSICFSKIRISPCLLPVNVVFVTIDSFHEVPLYSLSLTSSATDIS